MAELALDRDKPVSIAILQRVCTAYRAPLFLKLAAENDLSIIVYYGDNLPNSKVKSGQSLGDFPHKKLQTKFFTFLGRLLIWHIGLLASLRAQRPDVIICEGESNFLSYLQAMYYRLFNPSVKLVQWTLVSLPDSPVKNKLLQRVAIIFKRCFDAFIVYSSFGKKALLSQGFLDEKIFVAVNVSDTEKHLQSKLGSGITKQEARSLLNIPDKDFVCLFVGAVEHNKRLNILLKAFQTLPQHACSLWVVGDGAELANLKRQADELALKNVQFAGRVTAGLNHFYMAADLFVLPGRGGMVISEAMAFALPVLAYAADGTEQDLIDNEQTGILLNKGTAAEISQAIAGCVNKKKQLLQWGETAQQRIVTTYNTEAMCANIKKAIRYALAEKNGGTYK